MQNPFDYEKALLTPPVEYQIVGPNILFNEEDLLTIRGYARQARRLPVEPVAVLEDIGTHASVLGPEAIEAIIQLNLGVKAHAETWPVLQAESKSLGNSLASFSKVFTSTGDAIIKRLESSEAWLAHGETVAQSSELTVDETIELSSGDIKIKLTVMGFMNEMVTQVSRYYDKVDKVHTLAQKFYKTLHIELTDALDSVNERMASLHIDGQIKEIQQLIYEYQEKLEAARIDVEYYESVERNSWALLFFGRAIAELTVGADHREAITRVDDCMRLIKDYTAAIRNLNPVQGKISEYERLLADLGSRMSATELSADRLRDAWSKVKEDMTISIETLETINDQNKLYLFTLRFQNVLLPWRTVEANAKQLTKLFDAVEDEE